MKTIPKEVSEYMRMIGAKGNKNRPREFYVKMAKLSAEKRRKKLSTDKSLTVNPQRV